MRLAVCALADLEGEALRLRPDAVISLLAPDQSAPPIPGDPPRLILGFHDIVAPREALIAPGVDAIARMLDFAHALPAAAVLLIHCWMGVSRSPAAAFILACAAHPRSAETDIAQALRRDSPTATPNPLLVSLADDHLGRGGRMVVAIGAIGRGRDCVRGEPFLLALQDFEAGHA